MPTVLDWNPTVAPSEFVRHLRESLAAGLAVVLPGDVGYVVLVNPTNDRAPAQLAQLRELGANPPAVLAYGPEDPTTLGIPVSLPARRLMMRAWPARLTLAFSADAVPWPADWHPAVPGVLQVNNLVRFRSPEHPIFDDVFPALPTPTLVIDTLFPSVSRITEHLGDSVGLVVSAGDLATDTRPSVVQATASGWELTEVGAFPQAEIEKLAARIVLFVCTGNTCRSPMAEALAKKLLADRLGCSVEELPARGYWILSAGTAAYAGGPAAVEAAGIAAEFGARLDEHRSRAAHPHLLAAADEIIAMTHGHADAVTARLGAFTGPKLRLLCGDEDLDDPIGAGLDVYRECARTILTHLERCIPEWVGQ